MFPSRTPHTKITRDWAIFDLYQPGSLTAKSMQDWVAPLVKIHPPGLDLKLLNCLLDADVVQFTFLYVIRFAAAYCAHHVFVWDSGVPLRGKIVGINHDSGIQSTFGTILDTLVEMHSLAEVVIDRYTPDKPLRLLICSALTSFITISQLFSVSSVSQTDFQLLLFDFMLTYGRTRTDNVQATYEPGYAIWYKNLEDVARVMFGTTLL